MHGYSVRRVAAVDKQVLSTPCRSPSSPLLARQWTTGWTGMTTWVTERPVNANRPNGGDAKRPDHTTRRGAYSHGASQTPWDFLRLLFPIKSVLFLLYTSLLFLHLSFFFFLSIPYYLFFHFFPFPFDMSLRHSSFISSLSSSSSFLVYVLFVERFTDFNLDFLLLLYLFLRIVLHF